MTDDYIELFPDAERREVEMFNDSDRPIRVSSHVPLTRVNPAMKFDRDGMEAFHLDIPTWSSLRWDPQETKTVTVVAFEVNQ